MGRGADNLLYGDLRGAGIAPRPSFWQNERGLADEVAIHWLETVVQEMLDGEDDPENLDELAINFREWIVFSHGQKPLVSDAVVLNARDLIERVIKDVET